MSLTTALVALLAALAIDRWWGEPRVRLHPVVWMGHYLVWTGRRIAPGQPHAGADWRAFWAGGLAWSLGVLATLLAAHLAVGLVLAGALLLPPDPSWLWEAAAGLLLGVLLKPLLAWRMLRGEVAAVEAALDETRGGSLQAGRARLSQLVSRDVSQLTQAQVRESAIESLAENLNDSVVAPLFWFVLLGLPGAAVYRFANTADAMWGYRGLRGGRYWEWAGKWAARADDVLSWVPARITAVLLGLAATASASASASASGGMAWRRLRGEARRTPSPNSGWPMAAMALALGVRLGKPGAYVLNETGRAPGAPDTARALALASRAVGLAVVLACAGLWWTLEAA